mmetsp:Transcript_17262/g.24170  ORF Transcript_17262/g.24170 Transcript_17262/m.24170 type:complete len:521 (-) Transcript_17262:488-2050(-)|eukprot:CAMPEP_0184488726 /NCGR_PEP_ID=MMETSP0113_2-20130426/13105_1 /TAXON_ID=91329 /ORGANISM="Norrisiella sphaerica, Strain BC52" /LENGTH=520 /DNA_ID=CAMNT_0026871693 /DNA_START=126 /DNA_END=1688 /DNA_ORIENTATION=-
MSDPLSATEGGTVPKPGSDEDLAAMAARFSAVTIPPNSDQQIPKANSDEDLAALAARIHAVAPTKNASPTSRPQDTTKNSDADLRSLAQSIGAKPMNGGEDLNVIARQLLNGSKGQSEAEDKTNHTEITEMNRNPGDEMPVCEIPQTQNGKIEHKGEVPGERSGKEGQANPEEVKDSGTFEWVQYLDEESGCPYWYNTETEETTWEEPTEDFAIDDSAAELLERGLNEIHEKHKDVREGFICPKCMLDLGSQEGLVAHCKSCAGKGGSPRAPISKAPGVPMAPPKSMTMTDRLFGYFSAGQKDETIDVKDMLGEAGTSGGQIVNLTEKQLRKLIGLNKRNKALKSKLQKQTEKYNQNIKVLVERDRKYKILLRNKEEHHLKEVHVLKEQNARLARGIAQQHEEFKRKNFKVLKQNQAMGKQLSAALISLQEKSQLENDNKQLRQDNFKLREYIKRLKRELEEQKNIVSTLKDATKDAHKKIYELESKSQLKKNLIEVDDEDDDMPVASITADQDPNMASV